MGVAVGTVIIYSGIKQLSFILLYVGRVIVGASGESLHIIEGLFLREYFSPDQMSFVIVTSGDFDKENNHCRHWWSVHCIWEA